MDTRIATATIRNIDKDSRKIIFAASGETRDRHRTILMSDKWQLKNFNNNPITGYQHNVYGSGLSSPPDPDDVLGPGRAWVENKEMLIEIDFEPADLNPKADKIYRKVKNGSLNAVSVGFLPTSSKGILKDNETGKEKEADEPYSVPEGKTYVYPGQELLEVSVVNIPSNPDALKKQFRNSTAYALTLLRKTFNCSYGELEEMTVKDIIDLLDDNRQLQNDIKPPTGEDEATREEEKIIQEERVSEERDIEEIELMDLKLT